MADPEKPKPSGRPESPTTAKELDFDDEPLHTHSPPTLASTTSEDVAPPKPPRPLAPIQQAENTLKEAFPSIDAAVVTAVLRASGGNVEPAFDALLGMSDPESQIEPPPPPQPPRPVQASILPTTNARSQVLADEQYARQLAQHYSSTATYGGAPRNGSRGLQDPNYQRPRKDIGLKPNELYEDREHSFIDDDLPVIRENIKKGFLETQSKVNSWVTNLRKRIDGDDEDDQNRSSQTSQGYNTRPSPQQYGSRRSGELERRSADRERYDADPQVLGDDFSSLHIRDHDEPPRRSTRPLANPDLFKPTPPRPQSGSGRRVSFQDGPPEEIDVGYQVSHDSTNRSSAGAGRPSKWQPLTAVDPNPMADHDPFSLGDSDDEESKKKDLRSDKSEHVQQAATDAMAEDISSPKKKDSEPHENSSGLRETQDQEAGTTAVGRS